MALGYRAYFAVREQNDVIDRARQQLHAWLRGPRKGYDADRLGGGGGVQEIGPGVTGVVLEDVARDGARSYRARIVEESSSRWVTELTVHAAVRRGDNWVWLDVSGPDDGPLAKTPRLARDLLDVLPAYDGDLRLSSTAEQVGVADVEDLVLALRREGRRGLAFVAGSSPDLPLQPWCDYVARLLRQTNGLASGYVLDPGATERFAELMGPSHAVRPATIRTYEPGVLVGERGDALRHRVLGTERIVQDRSEHLAGMLGRRARDLALGAPLPRDVTRLDQVLRRRLDDDLVARARPVARAVPLAPIASPVVPAPSVPAERREAEQAQLRAAFAELMVSLTGGDRLTLEAVQRLREMQAAAHADAATAVARDAAVDQLQARIRDLETAFDDEHVQRLAAERRLEDEQVERLVAEQESAEARGHLRQMQQRFAAQDTDGSVWVAPAPEPIDVVPDSMDDLVDRMAGGELDRVVFTGDAGEALALDEHHAISVHARKAWEALLALQDYAVETAAGRCDRDVDGYLSHTPPTCRGFSASRHARSESHDVQQNNKYSALRFRPVPVEVDASGRVAMWAHFKLSQSGTMSPRLHYYDDTARTGRVYVGYIGPHLRTGQTN